MRLLALVAVLALAGIGAAAVVLARDPEPAYSGSEPPPGLALPGFTLRDWRGDTLSSADLRGKVVLVTFLDAQCEASCPIVASVVARALERLEPGERDRVAAVAITSDPAEDTPKAVEAFLERQRATEALRYLVGTEFELRPVWRAFAVLPSADTGEDDIHSAPLRIYSRELFWVSTLHAGVDLTEDNLLNDVRAALET